MNDVGAWRYRLASVIRVALLSTLAVSIANHGTIQAAVTMLPVLGQLPAGSPEGPEFVIELLVTVVVFIGAFLPLYKPRPRRILDTIVLAHKRVIVAILAVATIGYFDYTYALPRVTALLITPVLLAVLPAWFVWIRQRPNGNGERTIVVGDNPDVIERVIAEIDEPLLGYLCPTKTLSFWGEVESQAVADGGVHVDEVSRLGGLSRIEDVLVEYDVDTVILAFAHADRAEFFGALDACYEHGVNAKIHRDHSDTVLTSGDDVGVLLDVDIEPWDVQDYLIKRVFDIVFSVVGLVVLSPLVLLITAAIKVDDGGRVLYKQERTAVFGETFNVYKFRSMVPEGESVDPVNDAENDQITRVGRLLRQTHLDEIPQLWSILVGDMFVVGPRAVWIKEESLLEAQERAWRKRWFVKPGLTGLAQVNGAKSTDPEEKLRYDFQYVKRQSFFFDMKLVIRQVWKVGADVVDALRQ